jgi:hypothetical protein
MEDLDGTTVAWLIDENVPLPIHTARAWGIRRGPAESLLLARAFRVPACGSSYPTDRHPDSRQATVKCPR